MRRTLKVLLAVAPLAYGALATAQPTPAGPPFAVSAGEAAVVAAPTVAVGEHGESVFLWIGECGGEVRVCVRGYGAGGQPATAPVQLLSPDEVVEEVPAVAMYASGDFLAVWSRPATGFGREIVGRRFGLGGLPLGAVFTVAGAAAQVYARPAVALDDGGNSVVVWERRRFEGTGDGGEPIYTGVEILGRRLGPTGAPLGASFRVDGEGGDLVSAPDVAVAPGGSFLAAWESYDFGPTEDDVLYRRFAPASGGGATPAGAEARAHQQSGGIQSRPAVAASRQGTFLVAWQGPRSGGAAGRGVFAQFFGPAGPLLPFETAAGTGTADQSEVAAAGAADALVAVWLDARQGGSVYARRWSSAGVPLGLDFRVDLPTLGDPASPAVGAYGGPAAASGMIAGWTHVAEDFSRGIVGRRYPGQTAPPEPCVPSATVLCLGAGDRFRVTASWATAAGDSGAGRPVPITDDTGYFWFFRDTNLEVVVKVLDACGVNGRYWVFAAGLTNVAVDLRVVDTHGATSRSYPNTQGNPYRPVQDTDAFPCP